MRHPDAYQMLAYCTAYGLPQGYLVYAKDDMQGSQTHVIRGSGTRITGTSIDLEAEPAKILGQIDDLARMVAENVTTPPVPTVI